MNEFHTWGKLELRVVLIIFRKDFYDVTGFFSLQYLSLWDQEWLSCHAGCQEVSRCRTRGDPQK